MRMKRPNQVNSMIIWILIITFGVVQSCFTSRRNTPSTSLSSITTITTSFSRLPHEPSSIAPFKTLKISALRKSDFVRENENDSDSEESLHCYNGGKMKTKVFNRIESSIESSAD